MKVKELIEILKTHDLEAEVLCSVHNGETNTYGVVDYVLEAPFETSVYNDLFGTPGCIDERLCSKEMLNSKILFIDSEFSCKHEF